MRKTVFVLFALLLSIASGSIQAHGPRYGYYYGGPRVVVVAPVFPGYYNPCYPYVCPLFAEPAPTLYVVPSQVPQPQQYWYYCAESKAYHPYVPSCPGGWMKVVPSVPPPQ